MQHLHFSHKVKVKEVFNLILFVKRQEHNIFFYLNVEQNKNVHSLQYYLC